MDYLLPIAIFAFISGMGVGFLVCAYILGRGIQAAEKLHRFAIENDPQSEIRDPRCFTIPLALDKERVVESGLAQAVREEAQRIGRLN